MNHIYSVSKLFPAKFCLQASVNILAPCFGPRFLKSGNFAGTVLFKICWGKEWLDSVKVTVFASWIRIRQLWDFTTAKKILDVLRSDLTVVMLAGQAALFLYYFSDLAWYEIAKRTTRKSSYLPQFIPEKSRLMQPILPGNNTWWYLLFAWVGRKCVGAQKSFPKNQLVIKQNKNVQVVAKWWVLWLLISSLIQILTRRRSKCKAYLVWQASTQCFTTKQLV